MPNDHKSYSDLSQPEPQALPGENLRLNGFRTDIAPTGVACPKCGNGFLEPARGVRGTIYKCTNEPECRYYLTGRPTGKTCAYKQKRGKSAGI